MPEVTFAARLNYGLEEFASFYNDADPEFLRLSCNIFDSEDLIEKIYEVYLALITRDGWRGDRRGGDIADIGFAYVNGFYLPCADRVVLAGQVDTQNDALPAYAGLVTVSNGEPSFSMARRCSPPNGVVAPFGTTAYSASVLFQDEDNDRAYRRLGVPQAIRLVSWHVAVRGDGAVIPCIYKKAPLGSGKGASMLGLMCQTTAATINAWEDARHLWLVETTEHLVGARIRTPLRLGVSEEHVKSLFYARQAPLTETGRRRPILHWVRAHQRRIAAGIDIDVRRHLRGVEAFEMEGLAFRITQPLKAQAKETA